MTAKIRSVRGSAARIVSDKRLCSHPLVDDDESISCSALAEKLEPGALLAGVIGMNFRVSLFQATWLFYVVDALIIAIAPVILFLAKRRAWI